MLSKSKFLSILLVLSSLFFISCGDVEKDEIIDLTRGWEYSITNPLYPGITNVDSLFETLPNSSLSNLQKYVPDEKGTIWLRKKFVLPSGLKGEDISCYLGRITIADKTYLNGSLIGKEGFFPPHEFTAWNTARFYEIPESIVNQDGENILLVEIYVDGEGSIVSNPYIGKHEAAKASAEHERFWNSQINALFAFLMIIIAIYHLMIWGKNRNAKENLVFSIINFVTALYMSVFFLPELPGFPSNKISFLWFQKIFSSILLFTIPFIITTFVNIFFNRKEKRVILYIRLFIMAIPCALVLVAPDYVHLRNWRTFTQPFLLPPIAYILFLIARACVKKQKDAVPLLLGFTPLLFTAIVDVVLHDGLHLYYLPYFSSIGWQLVIIALLFVLANRFSNARKQAEYLNIHLTDEVEARTKELTESNEQLTTANTELEAARKKADDDMRLAAYVQQSFYPRWAPTCNDWEIAYKFAPNAGVSGDLYDFFTEGDTLKGAALFDVSGHGIGSGLVTMLAKNAISRKFTSDMNVKLGTVMNEINQRIIDDKGGVENYLTGILLRMDGNKVQCINASHPDVFLRNGKTGKCVPVRLQKTDDGLGKCGLVGISGLNVDYTAIQFTMEKGDALIMYTDCLSESTNQAGEQYSQEAVCETFASSGNGNAQSKLDHVLTRFNGYTAGVPLKDDLTVIVIQKK